MSRLTAEHLDLSYGGDPIVRDLCLTVPDGRVTAVVGGNGCGKSTLLRGLARLLKPRRGAVMLDGKQLSRMASRDVAQVLGLLPQAPTAPEGLTVADLVGKGRNPHQRWFAQWSQGDEDAVLDALERTGTAELAGRDVDELSGGQRQRVWIAMTLAQGTDLLLLDEPTTYLDLAHQVEVLDLIGELNETDGRTVVMVLHDINQACRYADHVIAMRDGAIHAQGTPEQVITEQLMRAVFGLEALVMPDPVSGTPMVIARSTRRQGADRPRSGGPSR